MGNLGSNTKYKQENNNNDQNSVYIFRRDKNTLHFGGSGTARENTLILDLNF